MGPSQYESSMNIKEIQTFLENFEQVKASAVRLKSLLVEYLTQHFPERLKILAPPNIGTMLQLEMYGVKITIRPEITAKMQPPQISGHLVAYRIIKQGNDERWEPIGESPLEKKWTFTKCPQQVFLRFLCPRY